MQEINIVKLLQQYSGEIVLTAIISCALSIIFKKIFKKLTNKIFIILSFIIGTALFLVLCLLLFNYAPITIITNSLTCGAISATLAIFTKRLAFMEKDDLKKQLECLLSSIVLSEQLDQVVDNIIEKIANSKNSSKDELKTIIKENIDADLSEDELENIVLFILTACGLNQSNTSTQDNNDEKNNDKKG